MLRKLYDWVLRQAASRHATPALAAVSFAESSVFPVPPDVMLAPMVFARPEKAYWYAFICSAASVFGAIAGYAIGLMLEAPARAILDFFGHPEGLDSYRGLGDWVFFWAIMAKGLTPIPFKIVTIGAGLGRLDFGLFLLACVITRTGRFFIVAALIKKFGPQIQPVIEKRLALFTVLFLVALVGGVVALKFLH